MAKGERRKAKGERQDRDDSRIMVSDDGRMKDKRASFKHTAGHVDSH
jgi:hypothetical protein